MSISRHDMRKSVKDRWTRLKLPLLVATLSLTLGVVACGGETTPTPIPGPTLPGAQELRLAGDELFNTIFTAASAQDAATFHELLSARTRERCTIAQVQEALTSGDLLFPNLKVKAAFLNLEDPDRALVQVTLAVEPTEGGLEGLATAFVTAFPFPMVREEEWKFDIISFIPSDRGPPPGVLSAEAGCPFAASFASEEASAEVSLEVAEARPRHVVVAGLVEFPPLEPPPGVRSSVSGRSVGDGEASGFEHLETDMALAELLEHYRRQVLKPGSVVQQEEAGEDLAVLTWTFRDDANLSGFGALVITPTGEGQRQVLLWMAGPALRAQSIAPAEPP